MVVYAIKTLNMKRLFLVLLITITGVFLVNAQQTELLEKISVDWQLHENDYPKQGQFTASFVFRNHNKVSVNLQDWDLYFSYPREIVSINTANATAKAHGGEFRQLGFIQGTTLAAGQSLTIRYVAKGKSMNLTDAPSGLYWLEKSNAQTIVNVTRLKISLGEKHEQILVKKAAAAAFAKNKNVSALPASQVVKILPKPVSYKEHLGVFNLSAATKLVFDSVFAHEAALFNQELSALLGKTVIESASAQTNYIQLKLVQGLPNENYQLSVTKDRVVISASSTSGIFYGLQSLKMLMSPTSWAKKQQQISIQTAEVTDAPRFGNRSFMLDVARNFQSKAEILKLLDLLALYKINTFHFHLNDDEGWRLEIKDLPELTQLGGRRGHTLNDADYLKPAYGSGPDMGKSPGSGYYTQQDFIEILKYAKQRHITVIPELETPGHARAAIKAMDHRYRSLMRQGKPGAARQYLLRDTLDQSVYRSVQGYSDNVMNIALPSTYNFIGKVVDEMTEMYRLAGAILKTVHLGGDEVPKGVWEKSPAIAQLMQQEKIVAYDDLWYHYIGKASKLLKAKNLQMAGWEEIAMRKVSTPDGKSTYIANPDFVNENFQVYVWNNVWGGGNEDLSYRLANAGYNVVLSAVTNYYFDLAYNQSANEPGLYWGGYVDTDKAFYFSPFDYYKTATEDAGGNVLNTAAFKDKERLTDKGKQHIVGIQSQLWSEKISGAEAMEYMLLPKLLGYAERAWEAEPAWSKETDSANSWSYYLEDWNQFANLLGQRELPRLLHYAGGFKFRVPPPGVLLKEGKLSANVQFPSVQIKYTTDGSEPTLQSKSYIVPIDAKPTIKLKTYVRQRGSKTITIKK
ncbi:Chitobiase precursor [compost metagenome]